MLWMPFAFVISLPPAHLFDSRWQHIDAAHNNITACTWPWTKNDYQVVSEKQSQFIKL